MKKLLVAALAVACLAASPVLAQVNAYRDKDPNTGATVTPQVSPPTPLPTTKGQLAWSETTVAVTANTWTQVLAAPATNTYRRGLIVGDNAGLGCSWSYNSSPASNEGFLFSNAGQGNSWEFESPLPAGAVYVKCASSGTITVATA